MASNPAAHEEPTWVCSPPKSSIPASSIASSAPCTTCAHDSPFRGQIRDQFATTADASQADFGALEVCRDMRRVG